MVDVNEQYDMKPKMEDIKPSPPSRGPRKAGKTANQGKIRVTTEAEREIILRMALAGKKPTEIAEFMGLKPNTVYKFIRSRVKSLDNVEMSAASIMRSPSTSPKKAAGKRKN